MDHHLTISRVTNRAINLLYASRAERWTFDTDEMTDSEALHRVLTIRDPGDSYMVRFVKVIPKTVPTCPIHSVKHLAGPCSV